jgi:hypothetical protein
MNKKFDELRKKMSPESRARAEAEFERLVEELPLHLRSGDLKQKDLAEALDLSRSNRLPKRS